MPGRTPGKNLTAITLNTFSLQSSGLYIHLPWCVRKCPYCDFNSHAVKNGLPEQEYVRALINDMAFESSQRTHHTVASVFLGGGTPSLFSGESVARIIEAAANLFPLSADCEITLEANPGTADTEHFRTYRQAGVNRLSLGFQSMNDNTLKSLGRIHTSDESLKAYEIAHSAGFNNINIDLMFGLPGQSADQGLKELEQVTNLQPQHLSWYQLTIEPNTAFAHAPPSLPHEDQIDSLHEDGIDLMAARGYRRYEVSAYSLPEKQCRHNINYWKFGDYLGVGAGAHGKITTSDGSLRYARHKHPAEFIQHAGTENIYQQVAPVLGSELLLEFLLNNLRLVEGFSLSHLYQVTHVTRQQLARKLASPLNLGLLEITDNECRATIKGYRYLNEILLPLIPA